MPRTLRDHEKISSDHGLSFKKKTSVLAHVNENWKGLVPRLPRAAPPADRVGNPGSSMLAL